MSRQTVSTKNVNTLINFAKSYAKTGEEIRGKRLTWGDICDQNKNGMSEIMDIISTALNDHILEGRNVGISKNSVSIKIKYKNGKQYIIKIMKVE